jgi:hypothetical protein
MKRFEFMTLDAPYRSGNQYKDLDARTAFLDRLNRYGNEGWRPTVPLDDGTVILEREKATLPDEAIPVTDNNPPPLKEEETIFQ